MSDLQQIRINYPEIVRLSNSELSHRTRLALDEFIQAVKQGDQVNEKAKVYQAYQDERLKRLNYIKLKYGKRAS